MAGERGTSDAGGDAGSAAEPDRRDPVRQTAVIVVGNVFFVLVVAGVWGLGYEKHPQVPWLFIALEVLVILSGSVLIGGGALIDLLRQVADLPTRPTRPPLSGFRPGLQASVVFGLSFLVIIALASLVWFTGLGIQSPFVPMAAAPAVFGPFIASNRRTVAVLLAFVIVVLIVITAVAPVSECGIKKCHDAAKHHPDRWAFCAVTAVFLLIAGSISALRLRRDRELSERDLAQRNAELEKENREHELSERDLAQRNAKLEKENRALRARLGDA